jgi:hypothetical protein
MTYSITTSRLDVQDKTSVDYDQRRSTGYGKMCNVDLGLLATTDQESGNRPHLLANIRRARRPLVQSCNPQTIYTNNSPEARTSINSPFSLYSAYSCAAFEFLALDYTPPNNKTIGISTPVGCLDLTI